MQVALKPLARPHQISIVEDADKVKILIEKEYEKIKDNIVANGFRKGNVPRQVAEKQPNFNKFDKYRGVFDEVYKQAMEQEKLEIIDSHDFEVLGQFDDESPLSMRATVYLMPKVLSFNFDNVNVINTSTKITDDMVDSQIKIAQNKDAKFVNVIDENYQLKNGDVLIVDYVGTIDGKEFKGGSAKAFRYIFGETKFIPGFEEQLAVMKANETKVINVSFPENYHAQELKGKQAQFNATLLKIESKQTKSIEEIAAIENKTVEEYRKHIYDKLVDDYAKIDDEKFTTDVISRCVMNADIEPIPDTMIDWELENEWHQFLYRMGFKEDEYLKKNKNAKINFVAQRKARTEQTIRLRVFLDYICKQQNITATEDDVKDFALKQANALQKSETDKNSILESIKKKRNYEALEAATKHDRATTYLVDFFKNKNAAS